MTDALRPEPPLTCAGCGLLLVSDGSFGYMHEDPDKRHQGHLAEPSKAWKAWVAERRSLALKQIKARRAGSAPLDGSGGVDG